MAVGHILPRSLSALRWDISAALYPVRVGIRTSILRLYKATHIAIDYQLKTLKDIAGRFLALLDFPEMKEGI